MNYLDLRYVGNGKFKPRTAPTGDNSTIGACCGSNWLNAPRKKTKHYGIMVYPENVQVSFRLAKTKYQTEQITTKNGVFNVSIRSAK